MIKTDNCVTKQYNKSYHVGNTIYNYTLYNSVYGELTLWLIHKYIHGELAIGGNDRHPQISRRKMSWCANPQCFWMLFVRQVYICTHTEKGSAIKRLRMWAKNAFEILINDSSETLWHLATREVFVSIGWND